MTSALAEEIEQRNPRAGFISSPHEQRQPNCASGDGAPTAAGSRWPTAAKGSRILQRVDGGEDGDKGVVHDVFQIGRGGACCASDVTDELHPIAVERFLSAPLRRDLGEQLCQAEAGSRAGCCAAVMAGISRAHRAPDHRRAACQRYYLVGGGAVGAAGVALLQQGFELIVGDDSVVEFFQRPELTRSVGVGAGGSSALSDEVFELLRRDSAGVELLLRCATQSKRRTAGRAGRRLGEALVNCFLNGRRSGCPLRAFAAPHELSPAALPAVRRSTAWRQRSRSSTPAESRRSSSKTSSLSALLPPAPTPTLRVNSGRWKNSTTESSPTMSSKPCCSSATQRLQRPRPHQVVALACRAPVIGRAVCSTDARHDRCAAPRPRASLWLGRAARQV